MSIVINMLINILFNLQLKFNNLARKVNRNLTC